MELALSPEDAAFRDEVRTFIAENYPQEMRVANPDTDLSKEQMLLWHRILNQKGWVAPLWPREYGGPGWSITRRFIFDQETTRAGTMPPLAYSVTMVGPAIYTFGDEAQKKRFLPRILSGEDWWCQGYFEPGSGSDLNTVRTIAFALGAPGRDASEAFAAFIVELDLPRRLAVVGVTEDSFELIVKNAMLSIFTRADPQPIRDPADVVKILRLAA
ncbi:acyl-CoA dehydrogenase family protein [Afipia sp. GAS231]|uniref:acyl-CoA dehydrogenase family protein n=1 Tax=Afipia sp. GAS231 TaxID=1882747 RepID=UPI00087B2031|nr:acyl-CoA dehydrogenase family protein [Afipia sp. GAS231]SDO69964.1 Acyl-CoA dehydrogenase, N-terminal domain [Afipia sp. GAS231]